MNLPSAPKQFIQYLEEDDRPQARLDRDYENGMGVSMGRLREDTVYDYKFVGAVPQSHPRKLPPAERSSPAELLTAKGVSTAKGSNRQARANA